MKVKVKVGVTRAAGTCPYQHIADRCDGLERRFDLGSSGVVPDPSSLVGAEGEVEGTSARDALRRKRTAVTRGR